jgi:DNA-binding transcriptional MocR family regulator
MSGAPPIVSQSVRSLRAIVAAAVDARLSRGDVACLAVIINRFNTETQTAWPSVNRLAAEARLDRRNVIRSLQRLSDSGYLEIERGGIGKSNQYRPTFKTGDTDATSDADATQPVAPTPLDLVAPTSPELTHKNLPKNLPSKSSRFADFWTAYPRKVGDKRKAEKSWDKQKLDRIADQIIANVADRASRDPQWQDSTYIPHPTTYLNQQRWNDDWRPQTRRALVTDRFTQSSYESSSEEELPESLRSPA